MSGQRPGFSCFPLMASLIAPGYYSVLFEHPDGTRLEINYVPGKGLAGGSNAAEGYAKNPAGWCESMWNYLGPAHPPMVKHTLLQRD
jgi:hypothetical protein